jgi:hypothetical protein
MTWYHKNFLHSVFSIGLQTSTTVPFHRCHDLK